MNMELWIPFVFTSIIILVIPGPTIVLVITQAMKHGRRSVIPLAAGVAFGDFTAMTLSLLGLGAIMSASAALFTLFKWIGACYLIYLGIKQWKSGPASSSVRDSAKNTSARSLFRRASVVTALNPKSIAFFVAFLPQFVDPLRPALPQMTLLGGTFLFLAAVNAAIYALFAGQLSGHMRKQRVHRWFSRCGGSALIGAGVFTAGMQRSA